MPPIDNWRALREALDAGPTGGRWRWEINLENKRLHLVGGPYREFDLTIMDFDRWGMSHAVATLRDTSVDGMNIMHRLPDRKDWIAPFPDRAHHANWCQQVTHPDMRWIQEASPKVIRSLLDERDRLAEDYGRACKLVADMHAAAVGEFGRGPQRGVIEDVADLKAERDRLAAEVESLRADAGRYRWLRGCSPVRSDRMAVTVNWPTFSQGVLVEATTTKSANELDEAIDAAMKGKP